MRSFLTILVAISMCSAVFAAEPAKADPAAAAAKGDDCDMCKAHKAFMKAGKAEAVKLDNGMAMLITADAKGKAGLDKAAGDMETAMKSAMDGKAKLCDHCTKMLEDVKAGKVVQSHGKLANGYLMVSTSTDAEIVKQMGEMCDKMAAPAKKK